MKNKTPDTDRRLGIMLGLAYGDALGRPTEFASGKQLAAFGDPFVDRVGINRYKNGVVTDDTQMSIAVARAVRVKGKPNPAHTTESLIREFIRWERDPKSHDGQRAPGMTCTSAVRGLIAGKPWTMATRTDSKGNGANMRVSPLALRTDWTYREMGAVAQKQAAITHGHATALAASELTAVAVRMLMDGSAEPRETLLDQLLGYAYNQRSRYHADWLGYLWMSRSFEKPKPVVPAIQAARSWSPKWDAKLQWWEDAELPAAPVAPKVGRPAVKSPEEYIERGWDSVINALLNIVEAPRVREQDPCEVGGAGWVAEEALATALVTLLAFPDDPTNALRRAAFTSGDSDSIASITGAMLGAAYGLNAFPSHWRQFIEYRQQLEDLTEQLSAR